MRIDPADYRAVATGLGSGRAPWKRVARAVLELAGPTAQLLRQSEKPWASVTFSGARHSFAIAFDGNEAMDAADLFIAALPDHEFAIPGRLVADATIMAVDQRALPSPRTLVEAELLVLDDA
jgi:hypothetical protein